MFRLGLLIHAFWALFYVTIRSACYPLSPRKRGTSPKARWLFPQRIPPLPFFKSETTADNIDSGATEASKPLGAFLNAAPKLGGGTWGRAHLPILAEKVLQIRRSSCGRQSTDPQIPARTAARPTWSRRESVRFCFQVSQEARPHLRWWPSLNPNYVQFRLFWFKNLITATT